MFLAWLLTFTLATGSGPMNSALEATEAPTTLRAAFTVELQSSHARRVYRFDPRKKGRDRWTAETSWEAGCPKASFWYGNTMILTRGSRQTCL